jgi:hypothetical protein
MIAFIRRVNAVFLKSLAFISVQIGMQCNILHVSPMVFLEGRFFNHRSGGWLFRNNLKVDIDLGAM